MTKQTADVRSAAVPLPASCPAEFRKQILEIRSGKRPLRKPVTVPVVPAQSADDAATEERERHTLQGALAAAIITLL
jgi:hypothetical protein